MPKPLPANYLAGTSGDDILDIRGYSADYTVDGRAGNDTIYGGDGHDSLLGGRGNDLIYGLAGDSLIDGGGGVDTVSFLESTTGIQARLQGGYLGEMGGTPQLNVLANVENLTGSSFADLLGGNRSVNELDGGAGDDRLLAWGTGDFLTGGAGADRFDVTSVSRTVTITDFDYAAGDRIEIEGEATFSWVQGSGTDADGNVQDAWIGTCDLLFGGTRKVVVLGSETAPTEDWII
jgi:Ca2+-binding RTX toxin-like protein